MDVQSLVGFNQSRRDKWVREVARGLPAQTSVLDLGAGECRYKSHFSHCRYVAQDFLQYKGTVDGVFVDSWEYGPIDYISDAVSLPVSSESFDVVLCTEVLEHVPEPIRVLEEISRILRIGGCAYLSAPLGSGLHQEPYHYYGGFTPHFYRHFMAQLGLEPTVITRNGGFYRLLLQEVYRGATLILERNHYPLWNPLLWLLRLATSARFAAFMTKLDEDLVIEQFTVGYFIEAQKVSSM